MIDPRFAEQNQIGLVSEAALGGGGCRFYSAKNEAAAKVKGVKRVRNRWRAWRTVPISNDEAGEPPRN